MSIRTSTRYQAGSLTIEKRQRGPDVWVYRWRQPAHHGTRVKRKMIVGTKAEYSCRRDALRAVDALRLEINAGTAHSSKQHVTVEELWAHYADAELPKLSPSTKAVYQQYYKQHIQPPWGSRRLEDVKAVAVERWLWGLTYAPGTKSKIRCVLSTLYQHAVRQEWMDRNPIQDVRQSAKRVKEPDILDPAEIRTLLEHLPEPGRTMVLVAALTALRVSEVLGLQWQDVDFELQMLNLRRGMVDANITPMKTAGSSRPYPMPPAITAALLTWQAQVFFRAPTDWVFAGPYVKGVRPYTQGNLLQKHIQPTAKRLGIQKRIGWHTFRRSIASLLQSNGATVKVTQELMRHATPSVTLGVYAQAVTLEKREAQALISGLILDPKRESSEVSA